MYRMMRALTRDDSGIAMLVVIGIMSIVTVLAVGSFALARQTLHESQRVEDESRAFRAAASGLEHALSIFEGEPITLGDATLDGTYEVTTENLGGGRFRLDSLGEGLDGTTELVSQEFFYLNLWQMNFAGIGPQSLLTGSSGFNGTSNIIGPFYMKGNFDIKANMGMFEGPLFVRGGNISVHDNSWLGSADMPIDVFCDGDGSPSVPTNVEKAGGRGVYVASISRSVPDIILPPLTPGELQEWATKAQHESIDNQLGSHDPESEESPTANLESSGGAHTYKTMIPPNTTDWSRTEASATNDHNPNYKFFGAEDGTISTIGEGQAHLTIGGSSFGAWGAISLPEGVTEDGDVSPAVSLTAGPAGSSGYPTNTHDDFAYDHVNKILYIAGTVFVDGPVTFTENMTYVGNGTIVANGEVNINGSLRPYSTNSSHGHGNAQGEYNRWALGIVTPLNINFNGGGDNSYNNMSREELRKATPIYAGAFYTGAEATFNSNNLSLRGTVLSGRMEFEHNNNYLITNPRLPEYLPDSLPGSGGGLLVPGLWVRN